MAHLCTNRVEGFGPHSSISSPIPTSCFVDTILLPLPVWVAFLLLPILFALSLHHRKQTLNPSTAHMRTEPRRSRAFNAVSSIYYILIVCNILMQTVEIVRLILLNFGVGLQPFTYVGLILGALLHWSEGAKGRIRGWQTINEVLWIGGVIMNGVQIAGLLEEGFNGRKGTKYPISDQVTDVAVLAGIYALVAILELVLGFWRTSRRAEEQREEKSRSGMSPAVETTEFVGKYPPDV